MNDLQVQYFLALAKSKNYTETARRLYVSQPAISKNIAAFEAELGFQLFRRTKGSVDLTNEGKIMLEAFKSMTEIFQKSYQEALNVKEKSSSKLNVAFLQGLDIASQLRSIIHLLKAQESPMEVTVNCLTHSELNPALADGEIDIGITIEDEVRNDRELSFILLYQMEHAIVANRNHPIAKNDVLDADALKNAVFFATAAGSKGFKQHCKLLYEHYGVTIGQIKIVPDIESVFLNVESGFGLALLSKTPRVLGNPNLKAFILKNKPLKIVAAWRNDNQNPGKNAFIKALRLQLKEISLS